MPLENKPDAHGKTRHWTLPTVLGLILGGLGIVGLIELRPQIGVSPEQPTQKQEPFSVPFRIENTGYFPFYVERVFYVARKVKIGGVSIGQSVSSQDYWGNLVLDRAQGESITFPWVTSPSRPPDAADIFIVADVRPWKFYPYTTRRYYRFTRFEGPYTGTWQWLKQPSYGIEEEIDKTIADYLAGLKH